MRLNRGNSTTYYTAEGGVVIKGGERNKHSMCVMPPSQAARQRTGKGEGKVVVKAPKATTVELGASGSSSHETERLYDQTDATLFMQHGLYRVCEMALNGGFDQTVKEKYVTWYGKEKDRYVRRLNAALYGEAVNGVLDKTAAIINAKKFEARRDAIAEIGEVLKETRILIERSPEGDPDIVRATSKTLDAAGAALESLVREAELDAEAQRVRDAAKDAQDVSVGSTGSDRTESLPEGSKTPSVIDK